MNQEMEQPDDPMMLGLPWSKLIERLRNAPPDPGLERRLKEAKEMEIALQKETGATSFLHHVSMQDAADEVIQNFESDPAKFRAWFESWRASPDLVFLRYLLWSAQDSGAFLHSEFMANAKHARNREARKNAYVMWEELRAQGFSKGKATPKIAAAVHLAESTVRKLLQGA